MGPLEFGHWSLRVLKRLTQGTCWSRPAVGRWSRPAVGRTPAPANLRVLRCLLARRNFHIPHRALSQAYPNLATSPCSSSRGGLPAKMGPLAAIVTPKWISSRRLCHKEMASQKVGCNPPQIPTTGPLREPRICTSRCHLQLRPGRNAHTPPPARNQSDKAQSRYGFIFLLMEPCSEGVPLKEDLGENIFLRVLTLEANPYLRGSWRADTLTVLVRHTTP